MNQTIIFAAVLAGSIAASHCVAAQPAMPADIQTLATLRGESLLKAAEEIDYDAWPRMSRPDLWRLLSALEANDPKRGRESFAFYCILKQLSKRGQSEDLSKFLKLYNVEPGSIYVQSRLLKPMFEIWVRVQMKQTVWPNQPVAFPPSTAPLPAELAGAAPELQAAWRYYDAITQPYRTAFPDTHPTEKYIPVQQNYPLFFKHIGLAFRGGAEGTPDKLKQYAWADWCGTGRDFFAEPQRRAVLMGLWRQGRWMEAVGALIEVAKSENGHGNMDTAWSREFLTRCGIDWEKLAVGSMLYSGYNWGASELAAFGSDAAVKYIVAMSSLPTVAKRYDFLKLAAAYVKPSDLKPATTGGRPVGRRIAPEIQSRLLAQLHAVAQSTDPEAHRETALEEICGLGRAESIPLLRAMLTAPRNTERRKAYEALKVMGQDVAEPAELQPVRLRVLANGAPLIKTSIHWATMSKGSQRTSSTTPTDEAGILNLPRDYFADNRVTLDGIEISSQESVQPEAVSFKHHIPLPANLDLVTEVDIQATEVQLLITGAEGFKTFGGPIPTARIEVQHETRQPGFTYFASYSPIREAVLGQEKRITLANGRYQFVIDMPGAQRWESGPIEVTGGKMTLSPKLAPGADLKFEIVAPGGETRDQAVSYTIWRDGKKVDVSSRWNYTTRTYRSLPLGEYKIRIQSSAERNKREIAIHPPYKGQEVAVVLDGTKPLVDVGEIRLEPATAG